MAYNLNRMNTVLLIVGIIISIFLFYFIYSIIKYRNVLKNIDSKEQSKHLIHLNDKNFSAITSKGITIVDFWAAWCKPCIFLTPIINELAENYVGRVKVAKFDVESNKRIPNKLIIRNIPTVIIFQNGREMERIIGVKPYNTYKKIIDKYLKLKN